MVLATQERKNRYHLNQCETQATRQGDGWVVTGSKSIVPVADQADAFILGPEALQQRASVHVSSHS